MTCSNKTQALSNQKTNKFSKKFRTLVFILEVSFVLALLILWLSSRTLQESKNLWVLFFYSFPSHFLIALVPHEPVLLYFGKFYTPLKVALFAVAGTCTTEAINYSVFKYVTDLKLFLKMRYSKITQKMVDLFKKAPFVALMIAGFSPVPFYPFRFLVVLAHYPIFKYIGAVFLSRTPRYIILAWVGYTIKIPDWVLITLFITLIVLVNFSIVKNLVKKKQKKENNAS